MNTFLAQSVETLMAGERLFALFEHFAAHVDKFNSGGGISFKETSDSL